jgi:transaldolase
MFMPMFEATNGRHGWLSGQLDPRLSSDYDQMVADAQDLRSLSPNVMIKVPATSTGMKVLRTITAMGFSTNVTTCFTMPQIMAAADAVMAGIADAKKDGVDVSKWRSVITMMIGRLTEHKALVEQAKRRGIDLTWADLHWFGVAVFRRAYQTLMDNGYLSKMLACSVRPGPLVAGRERYWDIEKIAGGEIVYTLPPAALTPLWDVADQMQFRPEINEPVPQSVLDKFTKIPYAIQSYDPNGMEIDQFDMHPATIHTLESFSQATAGLEKYVGERVALVKGR